MKINSNPFTLLLGIVMLLLGIGSFLGFALFPLLQGYFNVVYITLAVAVLLSMLVFSGRIKESVGTLLIVLWLGLMVVMAWFNINFTYSDLVLNALPIGAGIFLLIGI